MEFTILDLSKALIYDFHANVIKMKYNEKAQLQYTDTYSLTYLIDTENLYEDIKNMIEDLILVTNQKKPI